MQPQLGQTWIFTRNAFYVLNANISFRGKGKSQTEIFALQPVVFAVQQLNMNFFMQVVCVANVVYSSVFVHVQIHI